MKYLYNVARGAGHFAGSFFGLYQPHPGQYWLSVAVALDQFVNAVLGGDYSETISSRAAKARNEGHVWGCLLCRVLAHILGRDHCRDALNTSVGSDAVIPD